MPAHAPLAPVRGRPRSGSDPRCPLPLSATLAAWRAELSPTDRLIFDERLALARPTVAREVAAALGIEEGVVGRVERSMLADFNAWGIALPPLRWWTRAEYQAALGEKDRIVYDALLATVPPRETSGYLASRMGVSRQAVEKMRARLRREMEAGGLGAGGAAKQGVAEKSATPKKKDARAA